MCAYSWEWGGMKVGCGVIDDTRLALQEIVQAGWWFILSDFVGV